MQGCFWTKKDDQEKPAEVKTVYVLPDASLHAKPVPPKLIREETGAILPENYLDYILKSEIEWRHMVGSYERWLQWLNDQQAKLGDKEVSVAE